MFGSINKGRFKCKDELFGIPAEAVELRLSTWELLQRQKREGVITGNKKWRHYDKLLCVQ